MQYHDYIIIGAGPAGLQMGYFLQQAARDYLMLEADEAAGTFFKHYPRHRKLISLNKCYNWFPEPDFNLRYDWNSLLTHDYSHLFSQYTDDLYPHADLLHQYLVDFAEKFSLQIQYNTRVKAITRDSTGDKHFVLQDAQGNTYRCRCLLMATGAVKPNIPNEIEGIELVEGYEAHEIDPALFKNKRVAILGRGNSAFEIADHLTGYAATINVLTNGQLIKHAWQTHFVGDLRAINNTFLEMNQLKMPHFIGGLKVKKITKESDGTFRVYYEEEMAHWALPGTLIGVDIYDHVIRCTGWKYVEPTLFAPEITPEVDAKAKYTVLNNIWETTVPDLFCIGAAMANGERKATSGFIHGFRYNVRTLFHLLEERYHNMPFPMKTCNLTSVDDLQMLADELIQRISTTSSMFQMFGKLVDIVVLSPEKAEWYQDLPLEYALKQPKFVEGKDILVVSLELGYHRFPQGTDALSFIHPNDPGGEGLCTAAIHPVFRSYSNGELINEMHMQSGLFIRYDPAHTDFSLEFNCLRPRSIIMNFINKVINLSEEEFAFETPYSNSDGPRYIPWPAEQRVDASHLPLCAKTHAPEFVPDPAMYAF